MWTHGMQVTSVRKQTTQKSVWPEKDEVSILHDVELCDHVGQGLVLG
jgi:hypothetical protein